MPSLALLNSKTTEWRRKAEEEQGGEGGEGGVEDWDREWRAGTWGRGRGRGGTGFLLSLCSLAFSMHLISCYLHALSNNFF